MARRTKLTPTPFRVPRVPSPGRQRRVFERQGLELRPLAGPDIPLPPDQDAELQARWQAWQEQVDPVGSLPEFIVWEWLVNNKRQRAGIDFMYQHPLMGGRTEFGAYGGAKSVE